ncbi:sensor histidine kinase [Bhargavaea ginsengi]|nr:HAMP domain-containing sensor histidine kinase [Bhargavaea ginsengi]MCM3089005.1 HAMP domain-containing histidine kinase [Bhargavaea ginsengi]
MMFSKLSIRLGLLLFSILLLIELLLYAGLYVSLADERADEVIGQLLARGNTHRDVLEDHFDEVTLNHVIMMESASDFTVVVTDGRGGILGRSADVEPVLLEEVLHSDNETVPNAGRVLESGWREREFIVTDSPLTVEGRHRGHVYMLAPSAMIRETVGELGRRFLMVGAFSVLLTILVIPFLTRFITRPLLRMKRVTEQLASGGRPSGLDTARSDELGDLARSIGQLSNDLERMRNERNEFLASVAHELRTPITYIKGYADLASKTGTDEQSRKKYNEIIQDEAGRLNRLVGQLLDLARSERQGFAVSLSSVSLSSLAESVFSLVGPAFQEKEVQLSCRIPDDLTAELDAGRFQQVLLNLLDNALKHTPSGKEVTLEAVRTKKGVRITVTDEGEGIPVGEQSAVFERFYRVDKSRSRKSGGTGLGLAIVRDIVEAHGGTVSAETRPGGGTVMTITLERGNGDGANPARG